MSFGNLDSAQAGLSRPECKTPTTSPTERRPPVTKVLTCFTCGTISSANSRKKAARARVLIDGVMHPPPRIGGLIDREPVLLALDAEDFDAHHESRTGARPDSFSNFKKQPPKLRLQPHIRGAHGIGLDIAHGLAAWVIVLPDEERAICFGCGCDATSSLGALIAILGVMVERDDGIPGGLEVSRGDWGASRADDAPAALAPLPRLQYRLVSSSVGTPRLETSETSQAHARSARAAFKNRCRATGVEGGKCQKLCQRRWIGVLAVRIASRHDSGHWGLESRSRSYVQRNG
ncbi:hypothetical protein CMUS01_15593 [Colletotrichum musicola]|uniref:Uncharacterized protein n=1 Tax=Colletotrichum musicola TaxID=2175873 RepID=A0A8H6IV18_9PEZI|nr:hypothetical protein CMUS01_15593 [Colletotrichum musicola]